MVMEVMKVDVRNAVLEYLDRQAKFKQAEAEFNRYKKEFYGNVRKFMERKGNKSFVFRDGSNRKFSVSDVRPTKVTFDASKVRKALSEDVCEAVIVRDVRVEDMDGFLQYMEQIGADMPLVESFMQVQETVDQEELNDMVETGKVNMEDLEGCYELKVSDGYIKITEMEL